MGSWPKMMNSLDQIDIIKKAEMLRFGRIMRRHRRNNHFSNNEIRDFLSCECFSVKKIIITYIIIMSTYIKSLQELVDNCSGRTNRKTHNPPLQSIIDQTLDGTFILQIALSFW